MRRGENIYKRKDGRWEGRYIRYYTPDKKAKLGYIYGKSYNEVKRNLHMLKSTTNPEIAHLPSPAVPYHKILDDWLQSLHSKTTESTTAHYGYLISCHIRPRLGGYCISKITTAMIELFVVQLLDDGRLDGQGGLAAKTVTDILAIIKATMDYARHQNYPVSCDLRRVSVKAHRKEMRVLTPEEQKSLVTTLLTDTDLCKLGVLLSLYTGIRIGELCALKWENIDLTASTLSIRQTMQRIQNTSPTATSKTKVIFTQPKSQSSLRDIPLPSFMAEILGPFAGTPQAYILTGSPNRHMEPRTVQNHFRKIIQASGLAPANFHALRHTFATRCVEVGFEIKSLSEILGHSSVNITLERYVHSSMELKKNNMQLLKLNL